MKIGEELFFLWVISGITLAFATLIKQEFWFPIWFVSMGISSLIMLFIKVYDKESVKCDNSELKKEVKKK